MNTLSIDSGKKLTFGNATVKNYYGVYVSSGYKEKFWHITCPCGVKAEYPVNGLPEESTPHPCGNPDHWTVKYE